VVGLLVTVGVQHTRHAQAVASVRAPQPVVQLTADQIPAARHNQQTTTSNSVGRQSAARTEAKSAASSVPAQQSKYPLSARLKALVPKSTLLAHLLKKTAGYRTATSKHPNMHIPQYWYGYRTVLPIIAQKNHRLKVRLERRPNGSTTWIRDSVVGYSTTKDAILIDLKYRRLFFFKGGHRKLSAPVGIGAPGDPTPVGSYFVAFHAPPPNSGYGSVILATSAHSTTIKDFEGLKDAIVGIHGPLGEEAAINPNGARVSHGCIRMLNPDLNKIRHVPNGTPVIIVKH